MSLAWLSYTQNLGQPYGTMTGGSFTCQHLIFSLFLSVGVQEGLVDGLKQEEGLEGELDENGRRVRTIYKHKIF